MERYIRRINTDCRVTLFFWNKINPYNRGHLRAFSDADAVLGHYSFEHWLQTFT